MNNIDTSSSPVEQLWYTWSDVGLSTIHAGFRIRAASPGLTEIYSERVKNIERTMRYVLPPGTDRSITPNMAPVGLAFIRSEWNGEYLLIHKKYIGEDGVGRQGNFFAHALALGENRDFSTEDAIWQWEDAIWKTDSESLNGRSTSLPSLSIDEVYNTTTRFKSEHFSQVQEALQFVIEAYLTRKDQSIPIYIAAPADQIAKIAWIIAGLTYCLPAQLINGLTFSTYEPDINKATTQIVGTSWIPIPGMVQDGTSVLPQSTYVNKLAINCETPQQCSNLQNHPQTTHKQYAASFAAFAADSLKTGNTERIDSLRNNTEELDYLDIDEFLLRYYHEIVNTKDMTDNEIQAYLNSPSCAKWLSQKNSREKVIDCAIKNPVWGSGQLKNILMGLRGQADRAMLPPGAIAGPVLSVNLEQATPGTSSEIQSRRQRNKGSKQPKKPPATLAGALSLLAESIIPEVKRYMGGIRGSSVGNINPDHRQLIVNTLITLMNSSISSQDPTKLWEKLFKDIDGNKNVIAYLTSEWTVQSRLLKIWNNAFSPGWPNSDLFRVSWSNLGKFLRLGLQNRHPEWVIFSVQKLIEDSKASDTLTSEIAKDLEYNYSSDIAALLTALEQGQHFEDEATLIIALIKKSFTANLLDQSRGGSLIQNLFRTNPSLGQKLAEVLIEYDLPRDWLVDLYLTRNGYQPDVLRDVIQAVYPKPDGQSKFFLQNGRRYLEIGREDYIQSMVKLYQQLLPLPLDGKLDRLLLLLDPIFDQKTILSLLNLTQPNADEWYTLLEWYGRRYLQNFQQSPDLADLVVTHFTQLVRGGYSRNLLFTMLPKLTGELYLGLLLSVKELTVEQQEYFLEQYGPGYVMAYPKMPILSRYISTYMANFNLNSLEREEAKNFFGFLTHNSNYKKPSLDEITINKIEKWQIIDSYFHKPTTNPQTLQSLAGALYLLGLPNNTQFTERLTQAFLFCIRTDSDISVIQQQMQVVPKLTKDKADEYRFLYTLAEQAAEKYSSQKSINVLTPYLIFALALHSQERPDHFFHVFMDKLLYRVPSDHTPAWMSLNDVVEAHGLSNSAIQRWRLYLYRLELWDKITSKSTGRRAATSKVASRSSMPPTETSSPSEYSATVKREKSSLTQRARSIRLPWQKEQALDTPPTNGGAALLPPDATQTMYPPMNNVYPSNPDQSSPTDARYSGTANNNQSSNISSSGLSFGHHQQDSNRRGK